MALSTVVSECPRLSDFVLINPVDHHILGPEKFDPNDAFLRELSAKGLRIGVPRTRLEGSNFEYPSQLIDFDWLQRCINAQCRGHPKLHKELTRLNAARLFAYDKGLFCQDFHVVLRQFDNETGADFNEWYRGYSREIIRYC